MAQTFGQRMAALRAAKRTTAGTTGKAVKAPKDQATTGPRLKATTPTRATKKAGKPVNRGKVGGKPMTKRSPVKRTTKK